MSAELRVVGELVQVRMLRSVDGYGRRGTLVEVSLDVAAGLMENRLAEYLGVTSFVVEEVVDGGAVEGAAEPRGGKGNGARRRKAGSRRSDQVDAEPGEGVDAG